MFTDFYLITNIHDIVILNLLLISKVNKHNFSATFARKNFLWCLYECHKLYNGMGKELNFLSFAK